MVHPILQCCPLPLSSPSVDISRNEEVPVADVIADLMHANLL
jgi:hypothetical protein